MSGKTEPEIIAGRFLLSHRLARGGSGEVFAAVDRSTGAPVALKRLLDHAGTRGARVRFMREYYALSELRHPRIIAVYDYGVDRGVPYYTMELLDGHDLSELSPLPYREACGYLRDVASSLALLHARRLLHRDVSPRNVRRTSTGHCKLLDFGAMMPFGTPPNLTGTPPCIAPEALQGGALDQCSDLYSLGAVAYHLLTGRHAYPASELSALPDAWQRGIVRPSQLVSELPEPLENLVMSLLSFDAMKRPASAAEVIDWLSAIGGLSPEDNLAVGRSFLASSRLIGRNAECAQLQAHLSKTLSGRGRAVLISGEPGSGKTRMLAEAALIAQTCGLTVVRTALRQQRGLSSSFVPDLVSALQHVAPAEAARASQRRPLVVAALSGAATPADHSALAHQVDDYVREIARARPLLITVDDVHHADELAAAVIAALAHRTSDHALSLIASHDNRQRASGLTTARDLVTTLRLRTLDQAETALLSESLFGDVPNLERISAWFFTIAQGNPKLTLALAEQLLARGTLRYVAGSWVLPAEIAEPLPQDITNALLLRLSPLGPDARAMAELLSVRRGGASAEQLLLLAVPRAPDSVFRALEELVRAGVLESAGDEYAFVQDALRTELGRVLTPHRRQELHKRWAGYLLALPRPDRDAQLEAGWHLVHTDEELRGAQLLAKVAPELVDQRVSMKTAVPALERALEVYERHGRSLAERLRLRALLVMSSYLFDFRLADRYGEDTLDAVYPFTGLAEAERCTRFLGKRAGFALGVLWAALRWCLRPAKARGPHVFAALRYYAQSTMGLVGLRALAVDVPQVSALLERMRGFDGVPHPALSAVYLAARAIHLHGQGHGAEVHRSIARALARLERGRVWQMTAHEHADLFTGLLLLQGINETYREHSRALECAARLEHMATPLAAAASLRVSMTYYLLRADPLRAQHYRRRLDLIAIQSGSFWQVDWIAVPLEGLAGATYTDLIGMRRALERIDRLVEDAPAFAAMRQAILLHYCFRHGEFAKAAALGDTYMSRVAPLTRIGWASSYAVTALSYLELDQPQRALAICEDALAHVTEDDSEYFVFYAPLEAAYAMTLAIMGQVERSRAVFRTRVARLRASGEQARAVVIHEYRIKVARLLGDREALVEALVDLREAALISRNPSVIALVNRLAETPRSRRDSAHPEHTRSLSDFFDDAADGQERAKQALAVLGQYAHCAQGYLYLDEADTLQLSASLDSQPPPRALVAQLQRLAAANDTAARTDIDAGYCAYRLQCGFVVLRAAAGDTALLPESLLAEVDRSLRRQAS